VPAPLIDAGKSDALALEYDPITGQLSYSPPSVNLYLCL
jgi:hypothetical protein